MRRRRTLAIAGQAALAIGMLVACSRGGVQRGVQDVTASLRDVHQGVLAVQNGIDDWNGGHTLEGVRSIGSGTQRIRDGVGRMNDGLEILHGTPMAQTCAQVIDEGYQGVEASLKDLERGHALLTDDSPFNDDNGLAMVKLGLSRVNDRLAALDDGAKGLAAETRVAAGTPTGAATMVAIGSRQAPDPCAALTQRGGSR